jgi:hypothetical protein
MVLDRGFPGRVFHLDALGITGARHPHLNVQLLQRRVSTLRFETDGSDNPS